MISIVICSRSPERIDKVSQMYAGVFDGIECQVVGVHNPKSLAEGYNRAIDASSGELLIFSHDDIQVLNPDFAARLLGHMGQADLVGIAGANRVVGGAWVSAAPPHTFGQIAHYSLPEKLFYAGIWGNSVRRAEGIKVMDGVFLCAKRSVVEKVRFDEKTFDGFHGYDVDFTFSAYLAGFRLAVGCDLCILHESTGSWDKRWEHYESVFRVKHQAHFDAMSKRTFRAAMVGVNTVEELLGVMTPPWWDR